jgi:hypothetical protein
MTTGIDVIIAATTAAMTDAMTIVAMTAMIGVTTTRMIAEMIGVMIDVSKTTTTATTTAAKNGLHHHHLKGEPQWCVPVSQPRDQFHHRRSQSDQKQ